MLLAFCSLFVRMVDQTQMYPSSMSPVALFQGTICNNERLKGDSRSLELQGGSKVEGGPQTPLHTMSMELYTIIYMDDIIPLFWK